MRRFIVSKDDIVSYLVGFGVFLPIFFTLSGGLYQSTKTLQDSGGAIMSLPLPISLLTLGLAIIYLLPRVREARTGLATIFLMVCAVSISLLLAGEPEIKSDRKLIASLQVLIPFFGLLLGQLLRDGNRAVAKAFMLVLTVVVPFQLIGSMVHSPWLEQGTFLTDQLGFFTIYSHIQFVSLIFICALAYAVGHLFDQYKLWVIGLCVLMLFYVLKSWSYLTMSAYLSVIFALIFSRGYLTITRFKYFLAASFVFLTAAVMFLTSTFEREDGRHGLLWNLTGGTYVKMQPLVEGKIPPNVQERIGDWRMFGRGILETPKTVFVGHAQPMPREIRTSAHNWYVDVTYTFGVMGILPLVVLILYSGRLCWLHRRSIPSQTWWLAGIVFYLVVIDSNFKVTLRQPYPGIFAFFMWGLLLSRLNEIKLTSSD